MQCSLNFNTIFSRERVNTGRQLEFDLTKAVTIILMIWTHTYEAMSTGFEPSLSSINSYVRGSIAGAVTFMFCMGIGLSYTKHNSAQECKERGVKLLTTGFTLLLFREVIPTLLNSWIYNRPEELVNLVFGFCVDILQFAGLAFLLVGYLKQLRIGYGGMVIISFVLSILATLLEGVSTGCYPLDQILGFFWGTESESYFPLFNWFIFVAVGQWVGDKYQYIQDKKSFHIISLLVGTLLCVAYIYVSFNVEQNIFKGLTGEIYLGHRPFFDALICLPINVGQISMFYFISKLIPEKAIPTLVHPSKHINQYYCISWVILLLIANLIPGLSGLSTDTQVIIGWICILTVTIFAVVIYSRYLKERTESFFGKHEMFWSILVWTLCIASFILAMCLYDKYPNMMNNYEVGI